MADECDAFVSSTPSQMTATRVRLSSWGSLVLGAALGIAGLGYAATVHNSLAAQQELIARMQQQLWEIDWTILQ